MEKATNKVVEELAKSFKGLSLAERMEFLSLLPEEWFHQKDYGISDSQKKELDLATFREESGEAVFHTWEEVERYVRDKDRA